MTRPLLLILAALAASPAAARQPALPEDQAQQTGTFTASCSLLTADIDSANDAGTKHVRVEEPGGGPGGPPEVEWTRALLSDTMATWVQQTTDGGYVVAGVARDEGTNYGAYLMKLDGDGGKVWVRVFEDTPYSEAWSCDQTADGRY